VCCRERGGGAGTSSLDEELQALGLDEEEDMASARASSRPAAGDESPGNGNESSSGGNESPSGGMIEADAIVLSPDGRQGGESASSHQHLWRALSSG
jgi:hypothetical protein